MTTAREQLMQGLSPEQWEALHAYRMALRLHEGRYLVQPKPIAANPAAGSDFTFTVPPGTSWLMQSLVALLTTSAVVANRGPKLIVTASGVTVARIPPPTSYAASTASQIDWLGKNAVVTNTSGQTQGGITTLFGFVIPGGFSIGVTTTNLDAGDQWSQVAGLVYEVRERTANEMVSFAEGLASGAHVDLYPGLLLGL